MVVVVVVVCLGSRGRQRIVARPLSTAFAVESSRDAERMDETKGEIGVETKPRSRT